MNKKLKNKPYFIPKINNTTFFNLDTDAQGVLLEAHHSQWRPSVMHVIKEKEILFILDPVTHILMFKNSREKVNFKKLPYSSKPNFEKLFGDSNYRNNKLLIPCLGFQIEKDPDVIIAPYLFSDNPWDRMFSINLTMIAESKKYLDDLDITKPLFAMITLSSHVLEKPTTVNYIADRYLDEFMDYLDGFFLLINNLDCKKSDYSQLFGLSRLVHQLSENKHVLIKQIGSFGKVLCAFGLTGFISGINEWETFSLKNLEKTGNGFKPHNRAYIPELFTHINEAAAKKINYKCECNFCDGATLNTSPDFQNNHYLHCKMKITNDLNKLDREGKINYMINKLEEAEKFSEIFIKKGIEFNPTYLKNWKQILRLSRNWDTTQEEVVELKNRLKDLEDE